MQSLNIRECILLELQITQTRHHLKSILNRKMSMNKTPKNEKKYTNVHKTGGAYNKCVNNHYMQRLNIKELKLLTNQIPPKHLGWKKCLTSTPLKYKKQLSNVHKIEGVHLHWVNNHFAKLEYKGMKTVGVIDYTNQAPSKHFGNKNV